MRGGVYASTVAHRRISRQAADLVDPRPTFAEELERTGLLAVAAQTTRDTIAQSNAAAADHAGRHLRVLSCLDCTAPKSCCRMVTGAYLHEGAALAARLIDEGRDTPALRATLATAAHDMETLDDADYDRPCAFLGADDRCTVYDVRPSICGVHLITSPPSTCADRSATSAVTGTAHTDLPRLTAERFRSTLGLPALDLPDRGALPRMVLLCLEAWHRRDFVDFLDDALAPALRRYRWATTAG